MLALGQGLCRVERLVRCERARIKQNARTNRQVVREFEGKVLRYWQQKACGLFKLLAQRAACGVRATPLQSAFISFPGICFKLHARRSQPWPFLRDACNNLQPTCQFYNNQQGCHRGLCFINLLCLTCYAKTYIMCAYV